MRPWYPLDRRSGNFTHSHLPAGGDWLPLMDDVSLGSAGLAEQMLALALADYPETPANTRAEMREYLIDWIDDYRASPVSPREWA